MPTFDPFASAGEVASAVATGAATAAFVIEATLARIETVDRRLNAFTAVTAQRARATAAGIDAARAAGRPIGPLAGVPFAVKNLFDVEGLATIAGSRINRDRPPAKRDSPLIARLEAAGAILVGALNMGEYAYDFTGENVHDGPSRNPHDLSRMTGGSSGGSGGAVAGGLVPISLGSDTNGSIRVPASFCGIFGLKPTYGRLPRTRTFPFVGSLDHLGPLSRSVEDLALAYDVMQGADAEDAAAVDRGIEPAGASLEAGIDGLRLAKVAGHFEANLPDAAREAVRRVVDGLGIQRTVVLPEAERARAAAYVLTAAEGAELHLDRLRQRAADFDPAVRDRLIAGAMIPAHAVMRAQKLRRWFREQVREVFRHVDVIVAPATPFAAPAIGQTTMQIAGVTMPLRPNIGIYTQPISFIGLPVVAVPIPLSPLPIGVQIIAPPWREDLALRVARHLERAAIAVAPRPQEP